MMEQVHAELNLKQKDFKKPKNIISAKICTKCGKLAVDGLCDLALGGSCSKREYFVSGTEPAENCNCHVAFRVCSESGKLANEYCPEETVETRVYLIKDESAYKEKTQDTPNLLPKKLEKTSCDVHSSYTQLFGNQDEEEKNNLKGNGSNEDGNEKNEENKTIGNNGKKKGDQENGHNEDKENQDNI